MISHREARKGKNGKTVEARDGDIRGWNRFVIIMVEGLDENVSYLFEDPLFAYSKEFNSSSIPARSKGGDAAARDQCALFVEQIGLGDR